MRKVALLNLLLNLLIVAGLSHGATSKTVEVIGVGECADCQLKNIKSSHAFSGLGVTIDCKLANGELKRRGSGELDEHGKFKVALANEILSQDGLTLKEECYAQLHGASGIPCASHTYNGIQSSNSKIVFPTKLVSHGHGADNGKITFSPSGKLKFSSETCTSAFLWPHYKYPPFPKVWHKKKPCPPFFKKPTLPPLPVYKKPPLPPVPVYKKPPLPPVPVYKKPPLPPVPVYKKPPLPPLPIYKKPPLPPLPIYKKPPLPPLPIYKKPPLPPLPIYKKPPLPPIPTFPPIHKEPFPSIPKFPPIYKKPFPPIYKKPCPPFIPKIPPN